MRKWTAEEMNFFFAIIAKVRDEGTRLMKFDTDELRNLASRFSYENQLMVEQMLQIKYLGYYLKHLSTKSIIKMKRTYFVLERKNTETILPK